MRIGWNPTRVALLLLCALFTSGAVAGWCQSVSAVISGSVLDPTGAAVSGCRVVADSTGLPQTDAVTGDDGRFRLAIPEGGARIQVACKGFAAMERALSDTHSRQIQVVFRLRVADVTESVAVGAKTPGLSLDGAENQESQALTGAEMAALPIVDEDYVAFMSRFLDPSVTGAQGASLVINGVEGGNFYQAPNAIKSLEVNQDQYSAAYASAGRGRMGLITASGTSRLHGSLFFALRQHVFDATPVFSPIKPPENREDYQASATGPVGRGPRLHFAVSGQMKKNEFFAVVNAVAPSGALLAASPAPFYRDKVGGSLYFDTGQGKQWVLGLGRTDQVSHNGSVGGVNLPSLGDFNEYTGHFLDLQRTDLVSAHTLNQVRLALGQEGLLTQDRTGGSQVNVAGAFVSGSAQTNQSYKQYVLAGNELISTGSAGNTLRIGLDIPELSVHTDDNRTDRNGIYSYPSLAAYQAGRPDLFTVTEGNGKVRFVSLSAALFLENTRQFGSRTTLTAGARYYFQNAYHSRAGHVAPRAEFARSFGRQSHTVVRLGAGLFFDRVPTTDLAQLLQFNGRRLNRYILDNPPAAVVSTDGIAPSFLRVSPAATIPYVAQWSAAWEQQLASRVTLSVQGAMNVGVHQLRMLDVNAPQAPLFASRPNPGLGQILSSESEGHAHSESLDVTLKVASLHGMTHQLRYLLAKSLDDTDGFSYIPANSYAPEQDTSYASYDQRQTISVLSTWPLPGRFTSGPWSKQGAVCRTQSCWGRMQTGTARRTTGHPAYRATACEAHRC